LGLLVDPTIPTNRNDNRMAATAMLERSELLDMCERLGYPEALREEDFPVWRKDLVAEIACFAAPEPKNMATATMVAGTALGDHQRTHQFAVARALAAPICLLRAESDWAVFSVQSGVEAKLLSDGPPDENPALARFLAPEALLAAKREPQQLSLLDVDIALLDTARGAAGRELDERRDCSTARRSGAHCSSRTRQADRGPVVGQRHRARAGAVAKSPARRWSQTDRGRR
jgi:hypothetical protein